MNPVYYKMLGLYLITLLILWKARNKQTNNTLLLLFDLTWKSLLLNILNVGLNK